MLAETIQSPIRAAEFFCGIGGFSACLPADSVSVAVDINQTALDVFRQNFSHQVINKTIESLSIDEVDSWQVCLWWMSPPCQPFTRRGKRLDLEDPRSAGFLRLMELFEELRPLHLAMENVPEFGGSQAQRLLLSKLRRARYEFQQIVICPTAFGGHNRRRRYYLIASRNPLVRWKPPVAGSVSRELETINKHEAGVDPSWLEQYSDAMHIVDRQAFCDGKCQTNCFTSAYGRSPVRSGSYLSVDGKVRLFTPREIIWQLGFDKRFSMPELPYPKLWPLVGNSLALNCVRYVLGHLNY